MSNFRRKANYRSKRSCGLCKPHKRWGNRRAGLKPKYHALDLIMHQHRVKGGVKSELAHVD